jgi:hypothetical protein
MALDECLAACSDEACAQQCEQQHSAGLQALNAVYDCATASCVDPCYGGEQQVGSACDTCLEANCDAEWQACEGSADCMALYDCYDGCQDEDCYYACEDQHPTGSGLAYAFWDCWDASCAAECGA